jgi:hypothetical protein
MKIKILTIVLLFFCSQGICQDFKNFDAAFIKSFYKNFRVPKNISYDSVGKTVMLHIFIKNNLKTNKIEFSDNAEISLKNELLRIESNLNLEPFKNFMITNKKNELHVLFPIFIRPDYSNLITWPGDVYTKFNGETINQFCLLRPPLQIVIYETIY